MANKQINYYVENKYTDDIVYPYNNGEEDRYRKTEKGVLHIHKSRKGRITERVLPEWEFPLSEFDRMKAISDEDYRERNKGDVLEYRHTVSLTDLEETKICSQEVSAEDEYLNSLDEDDEEDIRTIENAMAIMDACLTKRQKKRLIDYFYTGLTEEEIAAEEGVSQVAIHYSLIGANKKIKKYLSSATKTTYKNAPKLYIGEGQEKQKKSNLS